MVDVTFIDMEHLKRRLHHPFPLMTAGICHIDQDAMQEHRYKNFEVTLRFESSMKNAEDRIDGVEYHTPFPSYVLKRTGMHHEYRFQDNRRALFFIYSRETELLLKNCGLLDMPPVGWFGASDSVFADIHKMIGLMRHSQEKYVADEMDMTAFHILQELFFLQKRKSDGRADGHQEKIRQIASYLENNAGKDFSMESLAARFGYSERGLYRHWREYFDVSPQQYVLERKIKRAEYLLGSTGMSVTAVAMQLNFENISYFSTCFRRLAGMSPREYRQMILRDTEER